MSSRLLPRRVLQAKAARPCPKPDHAGRAGFGAIAFDYNGRTLFGGFMLERSNDLDGVTRQ